MKKHIFTFLCLGQCFGALFARMPAAGTQAPDFTLFDEANTSHTLSLMRGKKIALYFYPKDNTPGCTQQACSIRDGYAQLKKAGIEVWGISSDSVRSHKAFKDEHKLPFTLLSDPEQQVAKKYGVSGGLFNLFLTKRRTFLIDEKGIIVALLKDIVVEKHADQIIKAFSQK